ARAGRLESVRLYSSSSIVSLIARLHFRPLEWQSRRDNLTKMGWGQILVLILVAVFFLAVISAIALVRDFWKCEMGLLASVPSSFGNLSDTNSTSASIMNFNRCGSSFSSCLLNLGWAVIGMTFFAVLVIGFFLAITSPG